MQLVKMTIFRITVAFIIGIIISNQYNFSLHALQISFFVFFLLFCIAWFRAQRQVFQDAFLGIALYGFLVCLGALIYSLHQPVSQSSHYTHYFDSQEDAYFQIQIKEVLKFNNYNERFIAEIIAVNEKEVSGKFLLMIRADSLPSKLMVDEVLLFKSRFQIISSAKNPHQFDYSAYMKHQGVYHQIQLVKEEILNRQNGKRTLSGYAHAIRTHITNKLTEHGFKKDKIAIINALLLGQQQDISPEIYRDYAAAGVIHVLSVSGLHVGILMVMLQFLFSPLERRFKKGKEIKMVVIILLLWGFAIIAGLSPPVLRSVAMFSFLTVGMHINRRTSTMNTLIASALVLLVFNANMLFHIGFQLSYLAVWGILAINPFLVKWYNPKNIIGKSSWQNMTVSLSAQTGVLPLTFYYFHQFPGLFLFANLVIIPFTGILLALGIISMLLAVNDVLPESLTVFYSFLIDCFNGYIGWIARQESFLFQNIPFSFSQMIAAYVVIISCLVLYKNFSYKNIVITIAALIVFQGVSIYDKIISQHQQLIVFQKNRNTIIGFKNGKNFTLYSDMKSASVIEQSFIEDFSTHYRIKTIVPDSIIPNTFEFDEKRFLVIDSFGVYPKKLKAIDYVLLTGSPKIHLDRLIDSISPKQIIADGNNYRSYVNKWKMTAIKREIPFYHTAEMGAFVLKKRTY